MPRRRKPFCPVLSLRAPAAVVAEIAQEARKRKISKSLELKRRLDFYAAAHARPAQSATAIAT